MRLTWGIGDACIAKHQPTDMTVHVLWVNAVLSGDGDSVALTERCRPSVDQPSVPPNDGGLGLGQAAPALPYSGAS